MGIVAGVQRLTSVSKPGISQVTLEFGWGREMDFAALDVRQKLDLITLPREARSRSSRFDASNDPIFVFIDGRQESLPAPLRRREEILKRDLESTDGVAAIKVNGGYEEEIEVRVDEGKLSSSASPCRTSTTSSAAKTSTRPAAASTRKEARYLVRAKNEFEDLDDIMETVLVSRDGRNVMMSDVATVVRGHKQREVVTRFGGKEAVELAPLQGRRRQYGVRGALGARAARACEGDTGRAGGRGRHRPVALHRSVDR